jgi:hypothetical protein
VFEKRKLRIFVPKWDDVTGKWRKLQNEEQAARITVSENVEDNP